MIVSRLMTVSSNTNNSNVNKQSRFLTSTPTLTSSPIASLSLKRYTSIQQIMSSLLLLSLISVVSLLSVSSASRMSRTYCRGNDQKGLQSTSTLIRSNWKTFTFSLVIDGISCGDSSSSLTQTLKSSSSKDCLSQTTSTIQTLSILLIITIVVISYIVIISHIAIIIQTSHWKVKIN